MMLMTSQDLQICRNLTKAEASNHYLRERASDQLTTNMMALGRLLTTPSRLLKMILPLPSCPGQEYVNPGKSVGLNTVRRKDEPIALLVHPQQPLSYLERLIQAELPPLRSDGYLRPPKIWFRAEADEEQPGDRGQGGANGKNVASYSGLGRKGPRRRDVRLVRWSGSTEVGDFIRDAARGREFHVDIEGHEEAARVSVPSFGDRTYYMRMRLRKMSRQIDDMSRVKNECDLLAHRSARHLAHGGFLGLAGWWGVVYYVTFHTEMGWDLVEPVTYLAGLAAIMGGYLWFLYMSRDLSYKAAMNVTVSRRQSALYQERGFDYGAWESLAQEANMLRREIRHIAAEYDVEWDELKDLGRKEVKVALESEEKDEDDSEDERGRKRNDSKQKESKPLLDKGDK